MVYLLNKEFLVNNLIQENNDIESEEEVEIEKQPESPNSSDDEDYRPVNKKKNVHINWAESDKLVVLNYEKDLLFQRDIKDINCHMTSKPEKSSIIIFKK